MSDLVMNLHFCDLCNESIPQADLDGGRAQRRGERLICAACEGAMSTTPPGAGGARLAPSVLSAAALPAPAVGAPATSGATVAVALAFSAVALVVGVGASAYFFWQLEERTLALRTELIEVSRAAPEHARTVSAALAEEVRGRESEQADVRAELAALGARLQEQEATGERGEGLVRRLDQIDARLAQFDDLASRVEHQARAFDQLALALGELSAGAARAREAEPAAPLAAPSAPPAEAVAVVPAGAPAWQGWVSDLASGDSGTRWQAVQNLGHTKDALVVPHLVPMLEDADIFVRMAACRHLGDLGSVEAIPGLIDTLEDEEASVREAALVALRGLSGQSIPFDPLARDGDRSKRVKAWRDWWEQASKDLLAGRKGKTKG